MTLPRVTPNDRTSMGRVILQPPLDGAFNMAADQVILSKAAKEKRVFLRLFQWEPWTLSLGKHQSVSEIDLERCRERKIMVVRRLTGGRAVLHARELTYSICVPSLSEKAGIHHDIALKVGQALCHGLHSLGAEVEWVPKGRSAYGQHSALCFASVARGEILWRGKKVVGSAQRVLDGVVLQHGSILLDHGHEQILELVKGDSGLSSDILMSGTATLKDILGEVPEDTAIRSKILAGFRAYFNGLDYEKELTHDEKVIIAERANSFFLGGWEKGMADLYSGAGDCAA
jgi:lipoate-protein ligase A